MAIEIRKSFSVGAPPAEVWAFLTDPHAVAPCLPGASITDRIDDVTHGGLMKIKVGPVTANYKGKIRFDRLDRDALVAEIVASGQETKGKGGAEMRMTSALAANAAGGTDVDVTAAVNVSGILAQFGRGMIEDISDHMFGQFVDCAAARLGPGADAGAYTEAPEEINALKVGAAAGKRAIGRAVRKITRRGDGTDEAEADREDSKEGTE
ncbi:MAG: SRPBCC family protein [Gemmatimonadota bacterium]